TYATTDQPFLLASGEKVKVPLMSQDAEFNYLDGDTFQALELPYKGRELSMVVLLPKKADGLADLEKALTPANLDTWLGKMKRGHVWVMLPRFQTTFSLKLKEELAALGVVDAFDMQAADLSGMAGAKGDLFIENAFHKAFVAVTEDGTEAAAAS